MKVLTTSLARRKMAEKAITPRVLAERTGYAIGTVYNLLAETSVSRRGRKKIEEILGPIWPEPEAAPAPSDSRATSALSSATTTTQPGTS